MENVQKTTPVAQPTQKGNLSAVTANESSKEVQKKFVAALLSLIGFTTLVPKGAEGLAATFSLDIGLALRMFAALYFSLPMMLIILWHIDLVMKERSMNENSTNNERYYENWFKIRLPLLVTIISIYLGFVVILPILDDEIITTLALIFAGIGMYILYIEFVSQGKENLLFHTPFLAIIFTLLASIELYTNPWSKETYTIAITAVCAGIVWIVIDFFRFSTVPSERNNPESKFRHGGRNSLLAESGALCLVAIILWYPSDAMRPSSYQSADTAMFNISLTSTNPSQYFNKTITSSVKTKSNNSEAKKTEGIIKDSFSQQALRFFQWRGIALLLIPMIALTLYRYSIPI